jgi:hypothetical protein
MFFCFIQLRGRRDRMVDLQLLISGRLLECFIQSGAGASTPTWFSSYTCIYV